MSNIDMAFTTLAVISVIGVIILLLSERKSRKMHKK